MFLLDILLIFILWLHFKDISVSIILISLGQKYCFSFHPVTGISQNENIFHWYSNVSQWVPCISLRISASQTILGADYMEIFNPGWNFNPLNWNFIQLRMKIWFYARVNSLFIFFKKNKDSDFTSTFQMDRWQIYQFYKMFIRIAQFICKILILEYW